MIIIKQYEEESYGNDSLVKDCIVMMECHEKYIVANFRRFLGWCDDEIQTIGWKEFDGDIDADYYYRNMIADIYNH